MSAAARPARRSIAGWLSWLGGADADVLRKVPARERDRFVQMAVVLLATATLAAVSMTFALVYGVKVGAPASGATRGSFWIAVPFALLWGLVILNLDRFLILNMGTSRSLGPLAALAAPRLLMAGVLAVVISTPLVLRVFASDITAKMSELQLIQSGKQKQQLVRSNWTQRVNDLSRQISSDEAIVAGHLPETFTTPTLARLHRDADQAAQDVKAAQKASDKAEEAWKCERAGAGRRCRGATSLPGQGAIADVKQKEFARAQAALVRAQARQRDADRAVHAEEKKVLKDANGQLATARKRARQALPGLRRQLAAAQRKLTREQDSGESAITGDTGLLAQLRALSLISDSNSMLRWARRFVILLFFLIESMPVAAKILMCLGDPTEYEHEVESDAEARAAEREKLRDRIKTRRVEARQVEEDKSQTRVALERDMRGHEKDIGRRANARVARQMERIVEDALKRWSATVRAELGAHGPVNAHPGPKVNSSGKPSRFSQQGREAHRQRAPDPGWDLPPVEKLSPVDEP